HVGADDAIVIGHRLREGVEVAALAAQAMPAHEHTRVRRVAPLPVRHAMQAARVQALQVVQARFSHFSSSISIMIVATTSEVFSCSKEKPLSSPVPPVASVSALR